LVGCQDIDGSGGGCRDFFINRNPWSGEEELRSKVMEVVEMELREGNHGEGKEEPLNNTKKRIRKETEQI